MLWVRKGDVSLAGKEGRRRIKLRESGVRDREQPTRGIGKKVVGVTVRGLLVLLAVRAVIALRNDMAEQTTRLWMDEQSERHVQHHPHGIGVDAISRDPTFSF